MAIRSVALLTSAVLLAAPTMGRADDFGKFLEKAARGTIRDRLDPEKLEQDLTAPKPHGEPHTIKTADGWTLVAQRYKPQGGARPGARPVILCHGLTYNAQFWDLDPACSFAQYLSGLGHDVWAVNLRGCGASRKWVFKLDTAPEAVIGGALRRMTRGKLAPTGYATLDPRFANWTMDDHIAYDVPAFVHLVRRETGAPEVTWVGHSMGGIVAIAHLARYQNPGIGRLVTVGSQVTMPNGQIAHQFLDEMVQNREQQLAGQIDAQELMAQARTHVENLFFNVRNVDPKVYEALSGWATDVPSIGLMMQYRVLASRGELLDAKKQYSYARNLANVKVPILISCGESDRFAPPPVQKYLHAHVGSADKTLVIFGRSMNFGVDAGHDDSLVGLNSREQVYPVIERWIAARP